ncbi:MAG: methyl-accepting chemotaxis protein [Planctomycetaceae bacterium]
MRFRDIRFHSKLQLLIGLFVIGFVAVFGLGAWTLARVQVTGKAFYEERVEGNLYQEIVLAKDLVADILPPPEYIVESYLVLHEIQTLTDVEKIRSRVAYFKDREAEYELRQKFWEKELPQEGELRRLMLDRARKPAIEFYRLSNQFLAVADKLEEREKVWTELLPQLQKHYEAHREAINTITDLANQMVTQAQNKAASAIKTAQTVLMTVGLLVLLAVGACGYFITRSIVQPTKLLISRLREMADGAGDLTARVQIDSMDEIGQLGHCINTVIQRVHDLVAEIKGATLQLLATTTQLAATSKEQEATLANFGASSSQIAAAVKEISATGQELSGTMGEVMGGASRASELASAGRVGLTNMESTMFDLTEATKSISNKLGAIHEKANDINVVVTTITKVADQTNLLSINAAIEAEKAGEYGRGFLVVAREIRRLADQTAVATLEIDQMVRQMQSAVSTGVMEMDKFNEDVRGGVRKVGEINNQMGQIIAGVQSVSERFVPVNEGMRNQSLGARQINDAMMQLTSGASQTQSSIREFNQATENLRLSVERLKSAVVRFVVTG